MDLRSRGWEAAQVNREPGRCIFWEVGVATVESANVCGAEAVELGGVDR